MTEQNLEAELKDLLTLSNKTNLVFNSTKRKLMVIATKQIRHVHNFDDKVINIRPEDKHLAQVSQFKLLGTTIDNNLNWGFNIHKIIKECFVTIATLK